MAFENAILLLYLLTLEGSAVSAIRSAEDQNAARIASVAWAEKLGITPDFATESIKVAGEIEEDQRKAMAIEPPKVSGARPNV